MKQTKLILSALAVVATALSYGQYASPEVMLVTDQGGVTPQGSTVSAQIERYDPTTGQYLGAFGAGDFNAPYGLALSGPNVYISNIQSVGAVFYSRISEYNWSTGAYVGSIFNSGPNELTGLSIYGTSILATDYGNGSGGGSTLYTFDLASGSQLGAVSLPGGSQPYKVTNIGNQAFVTTLAGGIYRYNLNANGTVNGAATKIGNSEEEGIAAYKNKAGTNTIFTGGFNGSVSTVEEYVAGSLTQSLSLPAASNGYLALGFGHNGMMYGLDNEGDKIDRYDAESPLYLGSLGSFKLNNTASGTNIAVYAAPEPLSVLGLGLGLAVILRRRRK